MMKLFNNFPQKISYISELLRGKVNTLYYNLIYRESKIGKKLRLGSHCNFALWGNYKLLIGDKAYLRNFCRIQIENGELKIGDNTFFNNFCTINCLDKITIGDNCLFGEGVKIYDHNHNYRDPHQVLSQQGYSLGEVEIGNNCWIGSNVVIMKGVSIGDNVIIGANSIIFKDIPSDHMVKSQAPAVKCYNKDN